MTNEYKNGEDTENYIEASLPDEMNDMQEGEERESVAKVRRKGGKLCVLSIGGTKLSPAKEDEKAAKDSTKAYQEEAPGPKKSMKPSEFMMAQPGMQKY